MRRGCARTGTVRLLCTDCAAQVEVRRHDAAGLGTMSGTLTPLSREALIQHLAIRMAAANRNAPILRGKAAPRDALERDRLRTAFAEWFVEVCIEQAGLTVVNTRTPHLGSDMAGFARRATPPQLFAG